MRGVAPSEVQRRVQTVLRMQSKIISLEERTKERCIETLITTNSQNDCFPAKNPFADLIPKQPRSAGPSNAQDWDWRQMYSACVTGARTVEKKLGVSAAFAPAYCACVRDGLQKIPAADRDKQYPALNTNCTQAAKTVSSP